MTGHPPVKVFIETTRENQESKRTESRKDKLTKLYESCTKGNEDLIDSLNDVDEGKLRSKDLYAYYMQQGKCMYCGKKIDLNDLSNNNLYDLDHIHPRSKKTDDSIHNNLVLVCKEDNGKKGDKYPLPEDWQKKMSKFWYLLKESGFITEEKYLRLTRKSEFTEDELSGFINRQLVETSQSVKVVAETLKRIFGDKTEVVYVKANAVSDFRNGNNGFIESNSDEKLKFVKCRSVNNYHHAKDAYLNVVVGNVYDTKFTKDYRKFVLSGESYNLSKMFNSDVEHGDVQAWKKGKNGTIATVQKYMRRNNILFTRFAYKESGQLFDVTPMKRGKGQMPLKKDLPIGKYGGYNKLSGSYYSLVEHTKNKKRIRTIQPVFVYFSRDEVNESELIDYMKNDLGLENPRILVKDILKYSTFEINGFRLHLSARMNDRLLYVCAEQLVLSEEDYRYCKNLEKYIEKSKGKSISTKDYGLNAEGNVRLFNTFIEKYKGKKYGIVFNKGKDSIFFERFIGQELEKLTDIFRNLPEEKQANLLNEILHDFQCDATTSNFEEIGIKGVGRIRTNNNISKFEHIKLIHQSPSGLFEQETDLQEL